MSESGSFQFSACICASVFLPSFVSFSLLTRSLLLFLVVCIAFVVPCLLCFVIGVLACPEARPKLRSIGLLCAFACCVSATQLEELMALARDPQGHPERGKGDLEQWVKAAAALEGNLVEVPRELQNESAEFVKILAQEGGWSLLSDSFCESYPRCCCFA